VEGFFYAVLIFPLELVPLYEQNMCFRLCPLRKSAGLAVCTPLLTCFISSRISSMLIGDFSVESGFSLSAGRTCQRKFKNIEKSEPYFVP
jgi:hypothetical protein